MKYFCTVLTLVFTTFIYSQQLRVSTKAGYAIGKTNSFKKIMLSTATNFGGELFVDEKIYLNISTGVSQLFFNYTDSSNAAVFNKKNFWDLFISLKKYYRLSPRSSAFWDFGIAAGYLFKDRKEVNINSNNLVINHHNLGLNSGVTASVGFKTMITNTIAFSIEMFRQDDYLASFRKKADKITTTRNYLIFSFYREFER